MTDLNAWLQRHDLTIDLITVWSFCLGFAVFGVVKATSWWTLRRQKDQTMVGVSLKRQKLGEALIGAGMSTLYGMTLYAYYVDGTRFSFWSRLGIRSALIVTILLVTWFGVQFVYYLRRASTSKQHGTIPLAHESED